MFEQVQPIGPNADAYASADDLTTIDDLVEYDVKILRWHKNGKPLKLRVKALDLEQQDLVNQGSWFKTNRQIQHLGGSIEHVWEQSQPKFCVLTLQYGVIVPRLTPEQAQAMRKHNPTIIESLANFIWSLSALSADDLERAALVLAPADPAAPDTGSDTGAQ